ncbi:MAG: CTP synthase [bacterium]|nr:CTP synthase [bacterium]
MTRYIFVAGGVMSSVGKGITVASIGKILQSKGFRVTAVKIDPYINVDAGTMNPLEHGETFVTDDGTECDQDIGNYERFLDKDCSSLNYMTTGKVYLSVITRERNLEYGGKCVEVVPHIPEEVISRIKKAGKEEKADFVLVEIGGTLGEYQNVLFLEAGRMMKLAEPKNVLFVLVTYLPIPRMVGEMKTKPTQNAARLLNEAGIQPDIIVARSEVAVDEPRKKKISMFCGVDPQDVISAPDVESIYEIPINFEDEGLGNRILKKFGLSPRKKDLQDWRKLVKTIHTKKREVRIGVVGKYFETGDFTLMDSYISVIEAIKHASWAEKRNPVVTWLSAEKYEKNPSATKELSSFDGVIVPGGFGNRGVEGKIKAIEYCRKRKIPYFGLCFGMQLAVIEFARNVCGIKNAHSTELSSAKNMEPVIDVMEEQKSLLKDKRYGGTMRLGSWACVLKEGSLAKKAYEKSGETKSVIYERHRHRYEVNNKYLPLIEKKGLIASGTHPEADLAEIMELKGHPFFLGTQFHPELKSRPLNPHPLFREFIRACIKARR